MQVSMLPMQAPKSSTSITANGRLLTCERPNKVKVKMVAAVTSTRRQPHMAAALPEKGRVTSEPQPTQNKSRPSVPSSMARRSRSNGMSGAQEAVPKPPIKKIAQPAHSAARTRCCRSFSGMAGLFRSSGCRESSFPHFVSVSTYHRG